MYNAQWVQFLSSLAQEEPMCVDAGGQGNWAPAELSRTRLQDMTLGKFFPLFVAQFTHQLSRWLEQIVAKIPSSTDLADSKNGRRDWRRCQLRACQRPLQVIT